jgi:two-component system OmpR family response regulator
MAASESTVPQSGCGPPRVLVVDDDIQLGELLSRYLGGRGLQVSLADNGSRFREAMRALAFDVVLLDLGLPGEDGFALMRELRARWAGPVIIVSGRGESVDRIVGLELGADDYVGKPFDLRELLARIRSVLRRAAPSAPESAGLHYFFDGLDLDVPGRRLTGRRGEEIPLTTGEFDLLLALLAQPHRVASRNRLMNAVHGRDCGPFDRSIDVQVGRLRRKIERDAGTPQLIKSIRGVGYLFTAAVRDAAP